MGKTYTVQVLTDKEFNNLPYQGISDSLGIADKAKGLAFVRETGIKDFDRATLIHEIDHLVSTHCTHQDEFGIMHKKGKDIFANIIPMVVGGIVTALTGGGAAPLVGPTMAAILGGASAAGSSALTQSQMSSSGKINPLNVVLSGVGSGLAGKGILSGVNASKAAGGGILGQTFSGIQGAVGITPAAAQTTNALTSTGSVISKVPGAAASATLPSGAPAMASAPASGILPNAAANLASAGIPSNILGNATPALNWSAQSVAPTAAQTVGQTVGQTAGLSSGNLLGGINAAAPGVATPSIAPAPATVNPPVSTVDPKSGLMSALGKITTANNLLGGGSLLSSTMMKSPQFEMPSSIEDIRQKLLSGGALTEQGTLAKAELSNILKSTPEELYPTENDAYYNAALRRTRDSYAEAQKQLDAAYNMAGVYGSGEHLAQKAKMQEELARTESALAAETESRRFELARTAKYQAIQDSLGVDKNTMDDLVGLTGLDVQTAAMVYGAKTQDVQQIREALGTLGVELLVRGNTKQQTVQAPGGINISLGQ